MPRKHSAKNSQFEGQGHLTGCKLYGSANVKVDWIPHPLGLKPNQT